jgi:hypothetical protein
MKPKELNNDLLKQFEQERGTNLSVHDYMLWLEEKLNSPSLPTDEEIVDEAYENGKSFPDKLKYNFDDDQAWAFITGAKWLRNTYHPKVDWEKFEYEFYGFMAYRRDNNIETSDQDIVKWVKSKLK